MLTSLRSRTTKIRSVKSICKQRYMRINESLANISVTTTINSVNKNQPCKLSSVNAWPVNSTTWIFFSRKCKHLKTYINIYQYLLYYKNDTTDLRSHFFLFGKINLELFSAICQHIFVMKSFSKNGVKTCEKSDSLVSCKLWLKIIYSEVTTATITTASKKIGKIYGYRH